MSDFIPTPVTRAAEARAAGASWPVAAERAGWHLAGLRRWVRDHQRLWARELGRARREIRDSACDEAVAVLRKQLRAGEEKIALQAAATLGGRFAAPRGRPRDAEPRRDPDEVTAEDFRQWEAHIAELDEQDRKERDGTTTEN